jgi:hypothetical protein
MSHPDIEFHTQLENSDAVKVVDTWNEALAYLRGEPGLIDVCIWSEQGAYAYGGSDAGEQYLVDPDASVFERWVRSAKDGLFDCQGMIP